MCRACFRILFPAPATQADRQGDEGAGRRQSEGEGEGGDEVGGEGVCGQGKGEVEDEGVKVRGVARATVR